MIGSERAPITGDTESLDPPILKVSVTAAGRITADGSPVTIESLRQSLIRLAQRKGAVWYHRETADREPPQQAMQVMEAIIENRLPVRLSSRPDFSDAVDLDGRPIEKRIDGP
jgi:biopolymer transport protein ExbD